MAVVRWNEWHREHIDRHAVNAAEAEWVVDRHRATDAGEDKYKAWGQTPSGLYLQVVFVLYPDDVAFVIHARDLTDREKRLYRRRRKMKTRNHADRRISTAGPKPYSKMDAGELADATSQYDREDLSRQAPLRGEKLRRYRRAMGRRGRPRIGKGSKAITVTLERDLLTRADRAARRRRISRSQLISLALIAQMRTVG